MFLKLYLRGVVLTALLYAPVYAQTWAVDPLGSTVDLRTVALADLFNDGGFTPADGFGSCPAINGLPNPCNFQPCVYTDDAQNSFFGAGNLLVCPNSTEAFDLRMMCDAGSTDAAGPGQLNTDAVIQLGIRGIGTRELVIKWRVTADEELCGDGGYGRACATLNSLIKAQVVDVSPSDSFRVVYEYNYYTLVTNAAEAFVEDASQVSADAALAINGGAPAPVFGLPILPVNATNTGDGVFTFNGPAGAIAFDIAVRTEAGSIMQDPGPVDALCGIRDKEGGVFCGELKLRIEKKSFPIPYGLPLTNYMLPVNPFPGGSVGYKFLMGKYELTNLQYAYFLNDAEVDGGATARSSFMIFMPDGSVVTTGGEMMFDRTQSSINYNPLAAVGLRYVPQVDRVNHPVTGLTWLGAVKFCNWMTIDQGLGLGERCYTEGPIASDWRPVTIMAGDWAARDLNAAERQALVDNYSGYRLPMDNLGLGVTGLISLQNNLYNEWYQAIASDPAAPAFDRPGPFGETVPAFHWSFGYGRDAINNVDCNYAASNDPFEPATTPVGYYNGVSFLADATTLTVDTDNRNLLYDLSGNVFEWGQDLVAVGPTRDMIARAGLFPFPQSGSAGALRGSSNVTSASVVVGMRLLQVASSCLCGDANGDGLVSVSDVVYLIAYIFSGGPAPVCDSDVDGSGGVSISDAVYLISYIFAGGPIPNCP